MTNWNDIDKQTKVWLREAGKKIIASFKTALDVQTKANPNDLVTNIDKETEQFFANQIRNHFPSHKILGEEGLGDQINNLDGIVWIIDPIDGTMNFIHQQRNFMISIGIFENGENRLGYIYDVVHDELYYAKAGEGAYWDELKLPPLKEVPIETALVGMNSTWLISYKKAEDTLIPLAKKVRGTRSYGSAALEIAYVATGRLDVYISLNLAPWDVAGGKVIVEELGGIVSNIDGSPLNLLDKSTVFIAKPGLHEKIMQNFLKK